MSRIGAVAAVMALAALRSPATGQERQQQAAPRDSTVRVTLRDGSVLYGQLVKRDADSVVVLGAAGRHAVAASFVTDIRNAGTEHRDASGKPEYWLPNTNTTRLLFGPTGRTLARGTGYFGVHELIIASLNVGVTNRIQLGGGTFIIPNTDIWMLIPKLGIYQGERLNISVGALYGGARGESGGIAYGVGTWGSADNSFTVGVGQGITGAKIEGKPAFMAGAERRISRRVALVTENYIIRGEKASSEGIVMLGARFLAERFTLDFALMNVATDPVFPGIPYVGFVIGW
ncbi:MAG: hypothetical protein IT356_11000 [Gemmatimonadaceae bacterium]|nr:hypothetical protein [Gemmatimonadaceae bacterium]